MAQKYIEDDFVMTRTEPNNFTPNGVVCKFVDYETIDKVLLRTINGIDGFIVEKGQFVPIPLTRVCHKSVTHPFLFFAFSQIRNL